MSTELASASRVFDRRRPERLSFPSRFLQAALTVAWSALACQREVKETFVQHAANDPGAEGALGELAQWFFDDYLSRWTSVANGTSREGPEFILDYWGCPLHMSSPKLNRWLSDPQDVVGMLAATHTRLRAAGYTHTAVLDSRVTVFHSGGAAIEVIWSRRAGQIEIERLAVHFQAVKNRQGWRVIGIQTTDTSAQSLDEIWPIYRDQHAATPYAGSVPTTGRSGS